MKLLAIKMLVPRRTLPVSWGIMTVANSDFFMREAYKGYNDGREKKLGFDSALYWYLESNATTALQSRYLLACTCLEVLTDRFVKNKEMEFILSEKEFDSVYETIKDAARTSSTSISFGSACNVGLTVNCLPANLNGNTFTNPIVSPRFGPVDALETMFAQVKDN